MEKFVELYDAHNKDAKAVMVSLRNHENAKLLMSETTYLPDDISLSERLYCWVNAIQTIPVCPVCGKPRLFRCYNKGYFATCGDKTCKSTLISKANKESHRDWSQIQKKMRATYAANHNGYTHNMQDPEFKEQYFAAYAEKHNGEKCGVCSNKAKENREITFAERGGLRNMLEQGIINKYGSLAECTRINNIKRAKIKSEQSTEEIKNRLSIMGYEYISEDNNHIVEIKCCRCGNIFRISTQSINTHYRNNEYCFCSICDFNDMTFRSRFEKEIGEEIKMFFKGDIQFNRYIGGYECDIVVPEKNIAIEANGCYWHTEEYKDRYIHKTKKEVVESYGYNLIQIWEDDWRDCKKHDIIISRLKSKFGLSAKIFARKCKVLAVSGKEAKIFLDENHIQGNVPSTYKYGLYYGNELVELATLGHTRKIISGNEECLELYRLCSKKGYNVVGGFSKLMKHIVVNHTEKIISYADCDWCCFNSNGYEKVGFKKIKVTDPGYTYNIDGIRKNRLNYTKSKLIKMGKDPNLTEVEIMHNDGYFRIYDSGNILFEYCQKEEIT